MGKFIFTKVIAYSLPLYQKWAPSQIGFGNFAKFIKSFFVEYFSVASSKLTQSISFLVKLFILLTLNMQKAAETLLLKEQLL